MHFKSRALAIASTFSSLALTSCLDFTHFSGPNATVAIQPQVKLIPVGTTQTFTTVTKNVSNVPLWSVNGNLRAGFIRLAGLSYLLAPTQPQLAILSRSSIQRPKSVQEPLKGRLDLPQGSLLDNIRLIRSLRLKRSLSSALSLSACHLLTHL